MATEMDASGFKDALVILGAAGIVIPAFSRIRINPVIGFILVGVLVGPSALGALARDYPWLQALTISDTERIEPFAEFGIILLLFAIGLELSFKRLWKMRTLVFGVGAAELFGAGALIGASLYLFGDHNAAGAFSLGVALAMSSTALALPLVGTQSPVGRAALGMLLFEDVALVPIIFALGAMAPYAAPDAGSGLMATLVYGTLLVAAMLVLGRIFLPRLFAQAARTKSPELFLAASLLVVITASLATTAVGLSALMGALIAGILIAETDYHHEVETITAPFRGLALGIFLITVGMRVNLAYVAENWMMLLVAVVGVLLIKVFVTALLLRFYQTSRGVAAEAGWLLSSPSETTLIVLGAAASAQLISAEDANFWQVVTAIGLTITPLLAMFGKRVGKRINAEDDTTEEPEVLDPDTAPVVIVGYGRVGKLVGEMLHEHDRRFIAVDADVDHVAAARSTGAPVRFGDVARLQTLDTLNLGGSSAVVLTMDDPVQEVRLTRRIRALYPDLPIIARARDAAHAAELYRAGATDAVPETLESSLQLSEAVLVDLGIAMGPVIASIHEKRAEQRQEIMELGKLDEEPRLRRRTLRDAAGDIRG